MFLSEVKCDNEDKIRGMVNSLGFQQLEFVPSVGRAEGLLLTWKDDVNIQIICANHNIINCVFHQTASHASWQLSAIYAPPTPVGRSEFWSCVMDVGHAFTGPWCILGDFNVVIEAKDKKGGRPIASSSRNGLRGLLDHFGLIDLGFTGKPFTWSNRRGGKDNVQERLDRGYTNDVWRV